MKDGDFCANAVRVCGTGQEVIRLDLLVGNTYSGESAFVKAEYCGFNKNLSNSEQLTFIV